MTLREAMIEASKSCNHTQSEPGRVLCVDCATNVRREAETDLYNRFMARGKELDKAQQKLAAVCDLAMKMAEEIER